ncbi:hypothetical protein ACEYYH_02105 [Microbacterium trichothecenolyticum]|uniref:hypothetical protein n=1 Tax=Microbacterium trichothecenolyticum TaxID=69370 RepID=UPI0035BE116F
MSESPRSVITWAVAPDDVIYWMHYADHCDLSPRERQAARQVREGMLRLLRNRDHADDIRNQFATNALTGQPQPTADQRRQFYEATLQFFQTYYGTLSAWSGFLVRLASRLRLNIPATDSMKRFIDWLGGRSGVRPLATSRLEQLEAARQFRAVFDHVGQVQPFEWDVFQDEPGFVERVRLYGPTRGRIPEGAAADSGPLAGEGGWSFIAPGMFDVANAIAELMNHFMPLIAGELPLGDEVPVTCPDFEWERDWNRDRPVHSEPDSLYLPTGALVDPVTGRALDLPGQTKGVARCRVGQAIEQRL